LELAGFECENCGSKEDTLHVHHRIYHKGREPWEYEDHELDVLCEHCHQDAHAILDEIQEYLSDPNIDHRFVLGLLKGMYGTPCALSSSVEADGFATTFGDVTTKEVIALIKDGHIDCEGVHELWHIRGRKAADALMAVCPGFAELCKRQDEDNILI